MNQLSMPKFIVKRLKDDWKLLLSIFAGIAIASTLVAGTPIYLQSLERLSINTAIDRSSSTFLDIFVFARHIPLDSTSFTDNEQSIGASIDNYVSEFYITRERYIKAPTSLVGTNRRPLSNVQGEQVSRGYFQSLTNFAEHVTFVDGEMASDEIVQLENGPRIQALVGTITADGFDLQVGDLVELAPTLRSNRRLYAEIAGIVEPTDPDEDYWQHNTTNYFQPPPIDEVPDVGVEVDPDEPPLPLFITQQALIDGFGKAFPGTLVSSSWFIFVDDNAIKSFELDELQSRIEGLEADISKELRGAAVFTGISALINQFERRSFFTSIPLLLLLTIMVITVLYYIAMMVSYLIQSREVDVALLRSRGVSTIQLLKLYGIEGLVLAGTAAFIAPFLAMGSIKFSGLLPYFNNLTEDRLLPVELSWTAFAVSATVGVLSLLIFVVPAVFGSRTGLIIHRLRSSRPPTVPAFQRYYVDVLVIAIVGIVFWEVQQRGQIVSGGLFSGVQVNEAMLFAPVLVLTAVALLFMRFFPIFVRYISGESDNLSHLIIAASMIFLGPLVIMLGIRSIMAASENGYSLADVWPTVALVAIVIVYRRTNSATSWVRIAAGLIFQTLLIALFVWQSPIEASTNKLVNTMVSVGNWLLIAVVVLQVVFIGLRMLSRVSPIWVSMALWHMARNPLQYSWLVLMLVMVTGLGVLATTVGGTLNRSYQERILYDTGTDIRVSNVPGYFARDLDGLRDVYLGIDGVTGVSLGLRGQGTVGASSRGGTFEILGLESDEFPRMAWYREDFSEKPLSVIMNSLIPRSTASNLRSTPEPIIIPKGAIEIGLFGNPAEAYLNMTMWLAVEDSTGVVRTVTLGKVGEPGWRRFRKELPTGLIAPLELVSIQIHEPVFGPVGTPGSIAIDDIFVRYASGKVEVLDDFESEEVLWTPLATSLLSNDRLEPSSSNVFNGKLSGNLVFGKDTDRGMRGVYKSPTGGPIPIVASSEFLDQTGTGIGSTFIIQIFGRLLPVTVRNEVSLFPTLNPRSGSFILADLEGLMRHINVVSPTGKITPNELFITEASESHEVVRNIVSRLAGSPDLVHDRRSQIEAVQQDPLIGAGWRVMVALSTAIIIFTAGLGYITYLLAFANRSKAEMGFLQSLGLSKRQMIGLLSLEHLVIIFIGLGLGTWAGFQMSNLLVSSVSITETGKPVVPPFILETDWKVMGSIYVVLAVIFISAIFRLARSMIKLEMHTLARSEG